MTSCLFFIFCLTIRYILEGSWESGFNHGLWRTDKHTLGFDFPNLPYLIDGDIKITQSNAIVRHIGRLSGLVGGSLQEQAHVDMCLDQLMDLRVVIVQMVYARGKGPKPFSDESECRAVFEQMKSTHKAAALAHIQGFSEYLNSKTYFCGESLTVCDFVFYELVNISKLMFGEKSLPENVLALHDRIASLPKVAAYLKSDRAIIEQVNNYCAQWEGPKHGLIA